LRGPTDTAAYYRWRVPERSRGDRYHSARDDRYSDSAAVDVDDRAVDELRFVGGEVDRCMRDRVGCAERAVRCPAIIAAAGSFSIVARTTPDRYVLGAITIPVSATGWGMRQSAAAGPRSSGLSGCRCAAGSG
jgi:hypothetical protein